MKTPLRVLHLETDSHDTDHIEALLADGGLSCAVRRVETRRAFSAALNDGQVDLILAEFSMPEFGEGAAFEIAQQSAPDIPFIFVSAALTEAQCIEQMRRGATDCIHKEGLGRLVPSVRRVLHEQQAQIARRQAEEALFQNDMQLRQLQKLEAVGRLAGGLAHDFNNLLTVIMGHSQVLLSEMGPDHPLRGRVEEMQKAGDRARVLIRQLLAFSRKQPSGARVQSLNATLGNVETMLRRLIGADIELTLRLSVDDLRIKADPALVEQIVMNLVVNARDAMPTGGRLTIETASADLDHQPRYHVNPLPPGEYVRLSVSDTGYGMSSEVQEHMFKPFFTTKEEGKGTGLGLSTVFGIVTESDGGLDVISESGVGTRFDVYLPRVASEIEAPADGNVPLQSVEGHETILLVEDEEDVRILIRDELRKLGYRIVEARNGIEACLVATPHIAKLKLLLTDIVMPGMSGTELARHLRVIKPELKLLFISGYTDDVGIGAGDPTSAYLQKPFTPEALASSVRELLDVKSINRMRVSQQPTSIEQSRSVKRS
ncbi:MAG: Sensory box histidine kinase/response regulator [Nitrospira sp.]|jgi:signal transduction histidine kinase/ActR/RegA family two-component response regulator|nr:MAG: Sensory box histidine kinase/response regulator [Nitrospira sp.]